MLNKIIVWDLFGGLNHSVSKALDPQKYEILTFDILKTGKDETPNIVVDLGIERTKNKLGDLFWLFNYLQSFPHPDIIVASPPCDSFSSARRYKDGGTGAWIINEDGSLRERERESWLINRSEKRNDKWEGVSDRGRVGANCVLNTLWIIRYFKPKYWYIENPKSSLMWNFIKNNCEFSKFNKINYNITNYKSYGFFALKPTIIASNIKMELLNKSFPKGDKGIDNISTKDRSDIPSKLIRAIFSNFKYEESN